MGLQQLPLRGAFGQCGRPPRLNILRPGNYTSGSLAGGAEPDASGLADASVVLLVLGAGASGGVSMGMVASGAEAAGGS